MHPPSPWPRRWAFISLAAAGLWVFCSLIPGGIFTTLPGVPFALFAFIAGWLSRKATMQAGDTTGTRSATAALGLSCFGCLWQIVYYIIWGFIFLLGAISLYDLSKGTPTP